MNSYRSEQIDRVLTTQDNDNYINIRISGEYGRTNYLPITLEEVRQIKKILTKGE